MGEWSLVGKLADGIAHEMNNVFATITGLASVLSSEFDSDSPEARDIKAILLASQRGMELTKNFLAFAQPGELVTTRVSVNELIGLTRSQLLRKIPAHITVERRLADDLYEIDAVPSLLKQALLQLGMNASDAIDGTGTVTFETRNIDREEKVPGLPPGRYVAIKVSDTGAGMTAEVLERAFEPFFTTKGRETSIGLGLMLVERAVDQHGGKVTLFSKPKLGTTVMIYLPVSRSARLAMVSLPAQKPMLDIGTALVVDDNALVLRSTARMLGSIGYSVKTAASGAEAIDVYRQAASEIRLALVDLELPDQDGIEVASALRKIDPDVRVVLASGLSMEEIDEQARRLGVTDMIRKPYTVEELMHLLMEL